MEKLYCSTDFKDLRKVHLLLGPECNMSCRHCHQTPEKEVVFTLSDKISDETLQFLTNYIRYSQEDRFTKNPSNENCFTVEFYGGEPLLHWKFIKKIVADFTDKFHILSTGTFRFSLVTNGLGLTEEIVDFVNKYQVDFSLSYDAPYPFAVRGYVSDKICRLANRIKNLRIICSGCAYNCDPVLAHRCLTVKFPEASYVIRTEVLRTFEDMDDDIDTYDLEKLRTSVRRLFISAKLMDSFAFEYAGKLLYMLVHPEANYFHINEGVGACVSGYRELSVMLDGKIPFCYNSCETLGSVTESTLDDIYEKASAIWKKAYDVECSTCECRLLCNWGCMITLRDENNHMITCEKYRKPFFKIVMEEMKILTEPLSKENYDWYREQLYVIDKQVQAFIKEGQRYEKEHTRLPKTII